MRLHNHVRRLDDAFPAILSGLVELRELGKAQASGSVKARIVELVDHYYREYIGELGAIIERLTFLNGSLTRLILAAKKILEEKP